jgi:hypothetical protein
MGARTNQQILGEYAYLGFNVQEIADDCLEIRLKDGIIAVLPNTASKRLIQKMCFDVVWGLRDIFAQPVELKA